MIAIAFAVAQESRDFRKALQRTGKYPVNVVHTGVGLDAARSALTSLQPLPSLLVSAGFAGALDPTLSAGDLVIATNYCDPGLLDGTRHLFSRPGIRLGPLHTHPAAVETPEAKAALFKETGALAVDMETEAIARWCQSTGVPLYSVRVISDTAHQPLPVPMDRWFDLRAQRPKPLTLLAWLALHPSKIRPFASFVSGLGPARRVLADHLLEVLAATGSPS